MPGSRPDVRCDACGKGHKEWFEIAGSRAGVEGVDETIKRWIKFGEDYAGQDLGPTPKATISAKEYRAKMPAHSLPQPQQRMRVSPGTSTARQTRAPTVSSVPAKVLPVGRPPPPQRRDAKQQVKMYNKKPKAKTPEKTTPTKTAPKKASASTPPKKPASTPTKKPPKKKENKTNPGRHNGTSYDSESEYWNDDYRPESP
jgi:hypothetical protein